MLRTISILILTTFLLISLSGCGEKTSALKEEPLKYVEVITLEKKFISKTEEFSGRIMPVKEINILTKSPGEVEEVYYNVGDRVKTGDILFKMDKKAVENNINSLKSQIDAADATVKAAQSTYDISKGSQKSQLLNQSEAGLEQAKIQYEEAKNNYEKTKELYEQNGAVSKQNYEQIKALYDQAKVSYDSFTKSHTLLTGQILDENISMAKNQLDQAVAAKKNLFLMLGNAQNTLADLEVKTPIDGFVALKNVEAGEITGTGLPSFTIVDINSVYIEIGVPETVINKITQNLKIKVCIDSLEDTSFEGTIASISPVANSSTLTYPVKIEIQNNAGIIKPGMFAKAVLEIDKKENTLVAPRNIFGISQSQWYAYIVDNGQVQKVDIAIGIDNGTEVEVISGLSESQQIIISGREYVKDGEKVQIKTSGTETP